MYYDQPPLNYAISVIELKKRHNILCIPLIFQNNQYFIGFKHPAGGPKQKSSLGGPPLQSFSVDRGRARAIMVMILMMMMIVMVMMMTMASFGISWSALELKCFVLP